MAVAVAETIHAGRPRLQGRALAQQLLCPVIFASDEPDDEPGQQISHAGLRTEQKRPTNGQGFVQPSELNAKLRESMRHIGHLTLEASTWPEIEPCSVFDQCSGERRGNGRE